MRRREARLEFDFAPPVPSGFGDYHLTASRRTRRKAWEVGFNSAANPHHRLCFNTASQLSDDRSLTRRPIVYFPIELFPNTPRVSVAGNQVSDFYAVQVDAGSRWSAPKVECSGPLSLVFDFAKPTRPTCDSHKRSLMPSQNFDIMEKICQDARKMTADFFRAINVNAFPWAAIPELTAARAAFLPATRRHKTNAMPNSSKESTL